MIKREIYMSRIRPFYRNSLMRSDRDSPWKICHAEPDPRGTCPKRGPTRTAYFLNFENMSNAIPLYGCCIA